MRPPPPASASPAQPTSGMQPKTTISSRLTWFVVALIILVATCQFGLRMLPAYEKVFADFGIKPPIVTQSVFKFGPAVLVTVGVVAAALMVLGEFTPELRGMRMPLILLVVVLLSSALAGVFGPDLLPRRVILSPSPTASTSPSQPTNAP